MERLLVFGDRIVLGAVYQAGIFSAIDASRDYCGIDLAGGLIDASDRDASKTLCRIKLDNTAGGIENYSYYVGEGAPRFVLTTEPVLPATNYAQFIVVAKDIKERES